MSRNPRWCRDELILALDLYFRINPRSSDETHPEVISLSHLLNELPIHVAAADEKFRNPNGVFMKLANFMSCDPSYPGVGLKAGSKLDKEVWDEFSSNPSQLSIVASAIKANYHLIERPRSEDEESTEPEGAFSEGKVLTRIHNVRERNHSLVKKKKKEVLKKTGKLACEGCGFVFEEIYGEIGKGFAECHHNRPVSELCPGEMTKLSDLSIVCANCHRMLHNSAKWLSINELKEVIRGRVKV